MIVTEIVAAFAAAEVELLVVKMIYTFMHARAHTHRMCDHERCVSDDKSRRCCSLPCDPRVPAQLRLQRVSVSANDTQTGMSGGYFQSVQC